MGNAPVSRDRRVALFVALAALWSVALLVLAFVLRYGGTTSYSGTTPPIVSAPDPTLIQENGAKVLIPLGLPLVLVLTAAFLMWRRHRAGLVLAGPAVWTCAGVIGAVALLGLLTVGPFIVPVVVFLVIACAIATPNETS